MSGKVYGTNGQLLSYTTISITTNQSGNIIAYAISDNQGAFKLKLKVPGDSIYIILSHVGYIKKKLRIANKTSQDTYYLEQKPQHLEDIVVESPPVYEHKDTLNL